MLYLLPPPTALFAPTNLPHRAPPLPASWFEQQATLRGDMAALFASLCFIGYLLIGRRLRAWMPAFVYAWAVTGGAAALLTLGALAGEGARLGATGRRGALGWVADAHFLPFVLYLAVGPGIVGHTGKLLLLSTAALAASWVGCLQALP